MCNDFFNLRRLFAEVDADNTGALDVGEARELIRRDMESAHFEREAEVERILAEADTVDPRSDQPAITLDAFRATTFYKARMCARIEQLADRAAARVQAMHQSPPWLGQLATVDASFAALVDGTCLEP